MAKLDLREGEELIEQAAASHVKKVLIRRPIPATCL